MLEPETVSLFAVTEILHSHCIQITPPKDILELCALQSSESIDAVANDVDLMYSLSTESATVTKFASFLFKPF